MKSSRKCFKMNVNVKVFLWGETFKNIHTLVLCWQGRLCVLNFIRISMKLSHHMSSESDSAVQCFSKEMTFFTSVVGHIDMWGNMQMINKKNSNFFFGVT